MTHREMQDLEDKRTEYAEHFAWTLALVFLDSSTRRLVRALRTNRDTCKTHGKTKAAECFDAALEATEEALEELKK